ncbi:MAG: carbohydrate-binding protein [Nitrosarchaeum sp.]|nr:carbohydrate-binding protein [Nitrosarchaeum sp.]
MASKMIIAGLGIIVFAAFSIMTGLSEDFFQLAFAIPGEFFDSVFENNLDSPTAMEFAPDGRLFVTQQGGTVKVIKNGVLLPTPFLSILVDDNGERGLNGIAFDPDFATNGFVYVYYTTKDEPTPTSPDHNRVSRFIANFTNPDIALPGNGTQILNLGNLTSDPYHNGGALHFGSDGKLYVAVGDNHESDQSQLLTSQLGKILRINSDGSIPSDNPFFNTPGAKQEIWALGFRNPFTFAFSPGTSKMYVNDVGQDDWEEVNNGTKGKNYGWPTCEGLCVPANATLTNPIYTYNHGTSGAAITGGVFYKSNVFPPGYYDSYFFGDYVKGFIKRLSPTNVIDDEPFGPLLTLFGAPVDIDVGPDGNLYYLSRDGGEVHKIEFIPGGANHPPTANFTANPTSGNPPLLVNFDGTLSTDPDLGTVLNYSWNFGDGFSDNSGAIVVHTYNQLGPYVAKLTVNDGDGGTNFKTINIGVGDPPVGTIITPLNGTKYNAGDVISFNGSATDIQDGTLSDSAFNWTILFHHNTHTHPFQQFNGVKNGTFTIPSIGEPSADTWFRIYLKVTNSIGISQTTTRDVTPNKSTITLASNIPGLQVNLDGQPKTTPTAVLGVVGMTRQLQALSLQTMSGTTFQFESWSDGGAATHNIITPSSDTVYTANSIVAVSNPIIHMSDTTASSGDKAHSGRQIQAENISPTSQLVGDNIDSITLKLKKAGSPTGVAEIGIFNTDLSVKKLFGLKDASTLTTSSVDYTFISGQKYQIQSGDRIGIKFTGGNSTNNISVMMDTNAADPFDLVKSYHTYYDTAWRTNTAWDMYMILKDNNFTPVISSVTPSSNSFINGGFKANYTLGESVPIGSITFARTGGLADGATHTYNFALGDNTTGAHSITRTVLETGFGNLVSGAIYTMAISATDAASNVASTISKTSLTYDTTAPIISSVTPASSSIVNGGFSASYTLSETVSSGTITFTRTGGLADSLTHTYNFAAGDKISGAHSIPRTVLEAGFGNPLVSRTIYNMTISATDAASNVATPVTKTGITYDTTGPCIPQAGTWVIVTTCKITGNVNALGNVDVQNGALVIIENGGTLNIDFATKYLKIHAGSGILVKSGGKIN